MGSSIFKDYDVTKQDQASAGPDKLWKIHGAKNKVNQRECSVWVVESKSIETIPNKEALWTSLKRDFTNLQRMRHPLIVNVSKPLEEPKGALVAETEPVIRSLSDLLSKAVPMDILEIKMVIIQICEALNFMHATAGLAHLNLTPFNIVLCNSDWKLCGFSFSMPPGKSSLSPFYDITPAQRLGSHQKPQVLIDLSKPSLDYLAPEVVFLNTPHFASDIFAFGCLIYELFGLMEGHHPTKLISAQGNVDTYRRTIENLFPFKNDHIPSSLVPVLEQMLSSDIADRPTCADILKSSFFDDIAVKTLQYISHIEEYDDRNKAEFFKGLKNALPSLSASPKMMESRVLIAIIGQLKHNILVPLILPNIFQICELLEGSSLQTPSKDGVFSRLVFPAIAPLAAIPEPFQTIIILLKRLDFMAHRIPDASISKVLVPMASMALDHSKPEVVSLALKEIIPLIPMLEHEAIRTILTPKVLAIVLSPSSSSTLRVQGLYILSKLAPFAARNFLESGILPAVLKTTEIDKSQHTIIAMASTAEIISKKLGPQFTAFSILPRLIPLTMDQSLNKASCMHLLETIQTMLGMITEDRKKAHDEDIQKHKPENDNPQMFSSHLPPVAATATPSPSTPMNVPSNVSKPSIAPTSAFPAAAPSNNLHGPVAPPTQFIAPSSQATAAYNAILASQEKKKQAAQAHKEKTTLLDIHSPDVVSTPTAAMAFTSSYEKDLVSLRADPAFLIPQQPAEISFKGAVLQPTLSPSSSTSSLILDPPPSNSVTSISPTIFPPSTMNNQALLQPNTMLQSSTTMQQTPASMFPTNSNPPLLTSAFSVNAFQVPPQAQTSSVNLLDDEDDFFDPRALSKQPSTAKPANSNSDQFLF